MPILYKYLHPDRVDILETGYIMLARARSFNDPFELNPHFDTLQEFTLPIPVGATPAQLEWIANEQKRINNALMPQSQKEKTIDGKAPTIVILSLSESRDNLLMWAHYAAGHTGFLIGFDSDEEILKIWSSHRILEKVKYRKMRPSKPTWEEITNDELLLNKSHEWKYEREWRIVDSLYSADGETDRDRRTHWPFLLNPKAVKQVIVGCRSGNLHEKIAEALAKPQYEHVGVLRALTHPKEYRLEFHPLWHTE